MSSTCVQPEADAWPAEPAARYSISPRANFALAFAILFGAAASCLAEEAVHKADPSLPEVRIQAQRQIDEEVTQQVQQTLTQSSWVYTGDVTITTHNGVVRVEGYVRDTGDWFRIIDLARKTRGVRRVDTSGLILLYNADDGG